MASIARGERKVLFFFYSHAVEERRIYHSWRERKERQRSLVLLLTDLAVCLGTGQEWPRFFCPSSFFSSLLFIMSQVHVPDPTMRAAVHDAKKKRIRKMSASRACVLWRKPTWIHQMMIEEPTLSEDEKRGWDGRTMWRLQQLQAFFFSRFGLFRAFFFSFSVFFHIPSIFFSPPFFSSFFFFLSWCFYRCLFFFSSLYLFFFLCLKIHVSVVTTKQNKTKRKWKKQST